MLDQFTLAPLVDEDSPVRELLETGQRHVSRDRLLEETALLFPIFRHQRQARFERCRRGTQRTQLASIEVENALLAPIGSEQNPRKLGAAGTDQSRKPEHLPGTDIERNAVQRRCMPTGGVAKRGYALDRQHRTAHRGMTRTPHELDVASHHETNQVLDFCVLDGAARDEAAVPQHREAVADLPHLL